MVKRYAFALLLSAVVTMNLNAAPTPSGKTDSSKTEFWQESTFWKDFAHYYLLGFVPVAGAIETDKTLSDKKVVYPADAKQALWIGNIAGTVTHLATIAYVARKYGLTKATLATLAPMIAKYVGEEIYKQINAKS